MAITCNVCVCHHRPEGIHSHSLANTPAHSSMLSYFVVVFGSAADSDSIFEISLLNNSSEMLIRREKEKERNQNNKCVSNNDSHSINGLLLCGAHCFNSMTEWD